MDKKEREAKRQLDKWEKESEEELKNFKLKTEEKRIIDLMIEAEERKKPYEKQIEDIQKAIGLIDEQKNDWNKELKERMGEERYNLYLRWVMQEGLKAFSELIPAIFLIAVVSSLKDLFIKKEE
jgi:septal ring factor EnvC (AmiA/AmiB activator)